MEVTSRSIRIDFIGAPGVGKSTLIKELELKSAEYLSRSSIKNNIIRKYFKKNRTSVNDILIKLYYLLAIRESFIGVDESKLNKFYYDHFNDHRKILLSAYKNFSNQKNVSEFVKEKRIKLLLDVLKDLTLYQQFSDESNIGLFDDSLSNMLLLSILPENISVRDFMKWSHDICISKYTDGVVYLFADRETIINRLNSRERVNTAHLSLNKRELAEEIERQIRLYERTNKLLSIVDIPVLELNSVQPVSVLQKISDQFIKSIKKN